MFIQITILLSVLNSFLTNIEPNIKQFFHSSFGHQPVKLFFFSTKNFLTKNINAVRKMSNRKVSCLFLFFWVLNFVQSAEENVEVSCNINVKKAVQCVSEKFLSITVDPAVLLAGVNLR